LVKKLKIELSYDPAIPPLLGIYPKECKSAFMLIAALLTIAILFKKPRCPATDGWIRKMWYIYLMEYYSDLNKNEIVVCRRMNRTGDHCVK
jgi:hypothetical protein